MVWERDDLLLRNHFCGIENGILVILLSILIICYYNIDYLLLNSDYLLLNITQIWDGERYYIILF